MSKAQQINKNVEIFISDKLQYKDKSTKIQNYRNTKMQKCKQSTCFQTDCSAEMKGELIREILFLEKLKNFKHVVGIIVAAIIIINDVILIITRGAQELQMRGIHLFFSSDRSSYSDDSL